MVHFLCATLYIQFQDVDCISRTIINCRFVVEILRGFSDYNLQLVCLSTRSVCEKRQKSEKLRYRDILRKQ